MTGSSTEPIVNAGKTAHNTGTGKTVPAHWLAEFAASGVSPAMARLNADWVEGGEAVAAFLEGTIAKRQKVTSYVTTSSRDLIERYSFLQDGAWVATGELAGYEPIPYIKPANPRWDDERDRELKYETPPGAQARPLFPSLTLTALKRCCATNRINYRKVLLRLWQQANNQAEPEDRIRTADLEQCFSAGIHRRIFWPVWKELGGRCAIAEGFKKAVSLTEWGLPAVCVRGVFQWHPKGVKALWPELDPFVTAASSVVVVFDQDSKLSTRQAVEIQSNQLGKAIAKLGTLPRFLTWDGAQGKGVDDVLAALPEGDRVKWLSAAIKAAPDLQQQQRQATRTRARAIRNQLPLQADRLTEGEYLPPLPKLETGAIHVLSAGMNSGKTYRMGLDWVKPWINACYVPWTAAGGVVVALSPLNSLGQQTAQDWGLPHIHDYGTDRDSQAALRADVSHSGGIVACPNSAHRVRHLIPADRPLLLIVDEAAQTFTDAAKGGTLGSEWANRWEDIKALMQRATTEGGLVLSEDGIDADTLQLAKSLSGCDHSIVIQHRKQSAPWQVEINRGAVSAWRGRLIEAAKAGQPQLIVTTSQKEARRLEKIFTDAGLDVVRIDSQTNEGGRFRGFYANSTAWVHQRRPQVLILSPSAKTGLSMEGGIAAEDAYFKAVWAYFPALDTDTQLQLLGRYRPNVPRYIWAPAFITPDYNEQPNKLAIVDDFEKEAAKYARAGGFAQAEPDPDDAAIKQYLAARDARSWAGKVAPVEALQERLEAAGHVVAVSTEGDLDEEISELWQITDRLIADEDSHHRAALEIDPETHDLSWANQVLQSVDSSHENRCKAAKVKMIARFPGLNWNDPQLWLDAVFCPTTNEQRPAAPGAALWAEADHYRELWLEDTNTAKEVLSQRLRACHLLPQSAPKAALAAVFRPFYEQLLQSGEIAPTAEAEQVKALALQHRDSIKRYWRLVIREDQSAIAIACKIARKFGLTTERSRRVLVAGSQVWVYSIRASATWRSLVEARKTALLSGSTNSLNTVPDLISKSVLPPSPDPSPSPYPPTKEGGGGRSAA
ncbi:DUF3854 domain-containing protein (plasmid) [Synechococcus elongatus IITB4]|uniref:DUF3854 domain-containing protein n=1 Tax=Synechococcus elongatus TaxID=32046 RepID=UPI0030D2B242